AKSIESIPVKGGGEIAGRTIIRRVGKEFEYQGSENLERVAIKNLKFPKWTRFKSFAGGAGAAIVITMAIETIIDAFVGASTRSKLQKGIEGLYGPRARLKMALLVNQRLKELIDKGIGDLDMMRELGYSEEILDAFLDKKAREIQKIINESGIEEFADEAARGLERLDKDRKSFTDDDKMDQKNCTDAVCWQ
ncbi:MAG: hypothetical protein WBG62_20440, partial [Cyclobacteriaceae bacterium]